MVFLSVESPDNLNFHSVSDMGKVSQVIYIISVSVVRFRSGDINRLAQNATPSSLSHVRIHFGKNCSY